MAEFWFYNLADLKPEVVLVALLEKCLKSGQRTIVSCSEDKLEFYDNYLWCYSDFSFLPHDIKGSKNADLQPVYLTNEFENPNGAVIRIYPDMPSTSSFDIDSLSTDYKRLIFLFGNFASNDVLVKDYEEFYCSLTSMGKKTRYWHRAPSGGWKSKEIKN